MTLLDWFMPGLIAAFLLFVVWLARQDNPSPEKRLWVRTAFLVGCLLFAAFTLAILRDGGVDIPAPLASLVLSPLTVLLATLINVFVRVWDNRFPQEGFAALAARVCAGLTAFMLLPWLVMGHLEPAPGRSVPPFMAQLAFGLLGTAACLGLWLVMWLVARRGSRR